MNQSLPQTYEATAFSRPVVTDIALLLFAWTATALIVNPVGEFPLIDDGVYESVVRHLLQTGDFRLSEVSTFPLITTALWGSLFCLPGGVSFTALRFSTLAASFLGILGTYVLLTDLLRARRVALIVTLTLGLNPAYYALSYTFMTDVPFVTMTVWAAVFFSRSLRGGSVGQLFLGAVLALAATLTRQVALAIPIAFAVTVLIRDGVSLRATLRASFPISLCVFGLLGFNYWLTVTDRLPPLYGMWSHFATNTLTHMSTLVAIPLWNVYVDLLYLGLFLLPVLLSFMKGLVQLRVKSVMVVSCFGLTLLIAGAVLHAHYGDALLFPLPMPSGHMINKSGLGLLTLQASDHVPSLPPPLWITLTIAALVGTLLLIAHLSICGVYWARQVASRTPLDSRKIVGTFLLLCGIIYLLPFLASVASDRYVVPAIPFFSAGIAAYAQECPNLPYAVERRLRLASVAFLAMFGVFSVCGTRDYLNWNRVRWQALRDLTREDHVNPGNIDGGGEFNSLYRLRPPKFHNTMKEHPAASTSHWNFELSDEVRAEFAQMMMYAWRPSSVQYVVAFDTLPDYTLTRQYAYFQWLPPHRQRIVVLRRR